MNMTRTSLRAAGVVGTAGALVLLATPATAADTATVSVLHAVPDTPVDVYANGERLIDDFQPGTLTDPLELPAGSYDLALFPADAADGSGDPLLSADYARSEVQAFFPGARLVIVPCGHDIPLEMPTETAWLLQAFLAGIAASAAAAHTSSPEFAASPA